LLKVVDAVAQLTELLFAVDSQLERQGGRREQIK